MYIDLLGKKRYKVNLHTHTTCSDGGLEPEKVIELYRKNGYDAIASGFVWGLFAWFEVEQEPAHGLL